MISKRLCLIRSITTLHDMFSQLFKYVSFRYEENPAKGACICYCGLEKTKHRIMPPPAAEYSTEKTARRMVRVKKYKRIIRLSKEPKE